MNRSDPWAQGAAPEVGIPDFPTALRGYERQQVDAYILELRTLLVDERQRAKENAEAYARLQQELATIPRQEPLSSEHLGSEAARVLEQAGNSARVLMAEARAQCETLVRQANEHSAEIGKQATHKASDLEAAARKSVEDATTER